jgi:small subunit ribosomal protein S6
MSLRRVYETTFIVNAALEDPDIDAVIGKVGSYIENHGGEIQQTDRWGRRRLAYPINKKFNGYYVHIVFEATPSTLPILERFMVLEDTILRHLTLVLPQKLIDFREKRRIERGIVLGFGNETEKSDNKGPRKRQEEYKKSVEETSTKSENASIEEPKVAEEPEVEKVEAE